jgi:hypothetical protein
MGAMFAGPKPPAPILPPKPPTSVDPAVVEAASQARRSAGSTALTSGTATPLGLSGTPANVAKKTALGLRCPTSLSRMTLQGLGSLLSFRPSMAFAPSSLTWPADILIY